MSLSKSFSLNDHTARFRHIDTTPQYTFSDYTAKFRSIDTTPQYAFFDYTARYEEYWVVVTISTSHWHQHFVIPVGVINGVNKAFRLGGNQFEVIINGLNTNYTRTSTGFTLDEAPRPGDYLWADVIM